MIEKLDLPINNHCAQPWVAAELALTLGSSLVCSSAADEGRVMRLLSTQSTIIIQNNRGNLICQDMLGIHHMLKLVGNQIYLATLERVHCEQIWKETEYDFKCITEPLNIGYSVEKANDWFLEIQNNQGSKHIRLGIFQNNNKVIGDIALQDMDWKNRSCTIGFGIAKMENRSKGYGTEAIRLLIDYAFTNLGLEKISATTLEQNIAAQKALIGNGFILEGNDRKAEYFAGRRWDRYNYSILREEYMKYQTKKI